MQPIQPSSTLYPTDSEQGHWPKRLLGNAEIGSQCGCRSAHEFGDVVDFHTKSIRMLLFFEGYQTDAWIFGLKYRLPSQNNRYVRLRIRSKPRGDFRCFSRCEIQCFACRLFFFVYNPCYDGSKPYQGRMLLNSFGSGVGTTPDLIASAIFSRITTASRSRSVRAFMPNAGKICMSLRRMYPTS